MLTIGQYVTDVHTGKVIKIISFRALFGMTTYQLYDADRSEINNVDE